MKLQHRVKFKNPRPKKPRTIDKNAVPITLDPTASSKDATKATVSVSERELKFARALTDTERHIRDTSLLSLRSFLTSNATALSEDDWARLWKALFYCVWMADKRPVISAVISDIVALTDVAGLPFLRALFACMAREWFGIDRLRLNKYYELIDKALDRAVDDVVKAADEALKDKGAEQPLHRELEKVMSMLDETVYASADRGALGLSLHVLDRYLDKIVSPVLMRAAKLPGNKVHPVFDAVMETPLLLLSSTKGYAMSVSRRIHERLLERLPEALSDAKLGLKLKEQRDMVRRASKRVWGAAAAKDALPEVRQLLYETHLTLKTFVAEADATVGKISNKDDKDTDVKVAEEAEQKS